MGSPVLVSHAIHLCVHMCLHEYMPRMCGCVQNTEKVLDALELELEVAGKQLMRMLEIQIPFVERCSYPVSHLFSPLYCFGLCLPRISSFNTPYFFSQALWFK